jgi:ribosomal protein S18 acetylase RimI-like enzyme
MMISWGVRVIRGYTERMDGYRRVLEARSTATSSARLAELARDEIRPVRLWTARNHNTPPSALDHLMRDEDSDVRWNALLHPRTPARALIRAVDDVIYRENVAHHPNTPEDLRRDLRAAGVCPNCSPACPGWRVYTHREPRRSRYQPARMFRRTDAERADQMLSWQRSDQAFFASGACHILAWAFAETHAGFRIYGVRPRGSNTFEHVIASNGLWAFDHCGWTLTSELVQAYQGDLVPIEADLESFCAANNHRLPGQFAFPPWPRARDYIARYEEPQVIELVSRFPVDDDELSALHARAFEGEVQVTPWRERLQRHALTWVGAFDAGRLVGFVQVCWDGGAHAFLLDTALDPHWQHQGVGRRLVEAAAAGAAAAGCEWLHVDFEPHLEDFYLRQCGFALTRAGLLRLARQEAQP